MILPGLGDRPGGALAIKVVNGLRHAGRQREARVAQVQLQGTPKHECGGYFAFHDGSLGNTSGRENSLAYGRPRPTLCCKCPGEDVALAHAIERGRKTKPVKRASVMKALARRR